MSESQSLELSPEQINLYFDIIQHVTPYLGRETAKLKFPDNSALIDDNDERNLIWLRELIFNKQKRNPIVLVVYNKSTINTINLYIKLEPEFRLIIQTPLVLYNKFLLKSGRKGKTIFDYGVSNNIIFHYEITPAPYELNTEVASIIKSVYGLTQGNIVILGNRKKPPEGNIYFIDDLKDAPKSVELVIDIMLKQHEEYINFAESVNRFFWFNNVIYYRLMNKESVKRLPVARKSYEHKLILEAIKYDYDPYQLFEKSEIEALNFFIQKLQLDREGNSLLELPLSLLPAAFLLAWRKKGYKEYPGVLLAILLDNKSFLLELFNFPTRTEDPNFNYINANRIHRNLREIFGEGGLLTYLNVFNEFAKNLQDASAWCKSVYVDYFTIYKIGQKLADFGIKFEEFNVLYIEEKAREVLKGIYGYTPLRKKGNIYYDSSSNKYNIDESYTIQNLKYLPVEIIPLVVEKVRLEVNVIYLYI